MTTLTDLSQAGVEVSPVGLSVLDPGLAFEHYEAILFQAGKVHTSAKWWIGDLLVFGEERYGERYAQAMDATGLSYSTLSNYRYVCEHVTFSRRRENLRFSHHAVVASFEPAEQEEWLDRAVTNSWTVADLSEKIKTAKSLGGAEPKQPRGAVAVLDSVGVVDASRNLSKIREALVATNAALESGDAGSLPVLLPEAMRALDESGDTVRAAAATLERPTLTEASKKVLANATFSGGFYLIEQTIYEAFATIVATGS